MLCVVISTNETALDSGVFKIFQKISILLTGLAYHFFRWKICDYGQFIAKLQKAKKIVTHDRVSWERDVIMTEEAKNKLNNIREMCLRVREELHGGLDEYAAGRVRDIAPKAMKEGPAALDHPILDDVRCDFYFASEQVVLRLFVTLDYFFLRATLMKKKEIKFLKNFESLTPENQYQYLSLETENALNDILLVLFGGLPAKYALDNDGSPMHYLVFPHISLSKEHKLLLTKGVRKICAEVFFRRKKEFCACISERVFQAYQKAGMILTDDLPGHYPGTLGPVQLDFTGSENCIGTLNVHVPMTYNDPIVWSSKFSRNLRYILESRSEEEAVVYVNEVLEDMVKEAAEKTAAMLPYCQAIPGAAQGAFPLKFFDLLTTGTAVFPHVTLESNHASGSNRFPPFLAFCGNGEYSLLANSKKLQPSAVDVTLDTYDAYADMDRPLPLARVKKAPSNLLETYRYCLAISDVIQKESTARGVKAPEFILSSTNGVITGAKYKNASYTPEDLFGDGSWSLKQTFSSLLQTLLTTEQKIACLDDAQLATLNELNPTELAVLRLVHQKRCTWRSQVESELFETVITKKPYIGDCLYALCKKSILTSDGNVPFLQTYTAKNDYNTDFCVYQPMAALCPGVLDKAVPRAYSFDEVDMLNRHKRGAWFLEQVKSVRTEEERGAALQVLENKIPRSFLQKFVDYPEGESFFRSLTGPDATRAKLLLGSIPGYKKRAKLLFEGSSKQPVNEAPAVENIAGENVEPMQAAAEEKPSLAPPQHPAGPRSRCVSVRKVKADTRFRDKMREEKVILSRIPQPRPTNALKEEDSATGNLSKSIEEQGYARGWVESKVEAINAVMKRLNVTASAAMVILKIPSNEQEFYRSRIES